MTTTHDDELYEILADYSNDLHNVKKRNGKLPAQAAVERLKARELATREDERKIVALDNYHGHTFSDATDYKGKFDKFVENNERRLATLK